MAISKRKNRSARWVIAAASGIATLGFWYAVVTGPPPTNANPPSTSIDQPAATTPGLSSNQDGGFYAPPSYAPPSSLYQPRFRTRAS